MITSLNEYVDNPFFNLDLLSKKKYKPIYEQGLIFIRFIDKTGVDKETGEIYVNYHDAVNSGSKESIKFLKWFENKFNIKIDNSINYKNTEYEEYYNIFRCKRGEEKNKLIELSKCRYINDIDLVDIKGIKITQYTNDIINELSSLTEIGSNNDINIKNILSNTNKKINDLLNNYY